MKSNDWKDETLTVAISKRARICNYDTFDVLKRERVVTVGDAIRFGSERMLMSRGFGNKYNDALIGFIGEHDSDLAAEYASGKTAEYWSIECYEF